MTLKNVVLVGCFIFALDSVASDGRERRGEKIQKKFTLALLKAFEYRNAGYPVSIYYYYPSMSDKTNWINIRLNADRLCRILVEHGDSGKIDRFCFTANDYLKKSKPKDLQELQRMLGMPAGTSLNCVTLRQHLDVLNEDGRSQ